MVLWVGWGWEGRSGIGFGRVELYLLGMQPRAQSTLGRVWDGGGDLVLPEVTVNAGLGELPRD